jgi:hypothetical protein
MARGGSAFVSTCSGQISHGGEGRAITHTQNG